MATSSWNLRSLFSQDASRRKQDISGVTNKRSDHLYSPLIDDKKSRMRGTHTVRSHGFVVAKTHVYDWLILIVLTIIMIILNCIHPFYRHVGKDMMTDLKYPLKDNTIPLWSIPVYTILFPVTVFLAFYFRRRDVYDLHHAILGLLFSMILTGVITFAIKDAVGRPRPDFFWRCFPDGKDLYDQLGNVICHGDSDVIKEGHKSFPSGHTSGSFSGLGFLSLYLSGKVRVFDCKGRVSKLCIVFLPLLIASLVGISRVDDYWHHWQDVFAGALIGITMAAFCYLQFFAPPYHTEGWGPYAFFRALEETRSNAQEAGPSVSEANVLSTEVPALDSSLDDPHLTLYDPESGIR
ncbi:lipid phosphate phosphatase 2-like protein isoform X1 [Tanacetum coccineum]